MFHAPIAVLAMIVTVAASNYLVQFPINDVLTWGAFTYPVSFLVTELTNRLYGPKRARQVVYAGFAAAVLVSAFLASPRIALASGTAFLAAQLLDVSVFNRLRQGSWWRAPLAASLAGSLLDTALFWSIAFLGEDIPLLTLAAGDMSVKLLMALLMLTPFRLIVWRWQMALAR